MAETAKKKEIKVELYTPHQAQRIFHQESIINNEIWKRSRFRISACGRRWGKTLSAGNELLQFALEYNDVLCQWVAPRYKQAKIPFRFIRKAFRNTGLFSDVSKTDLRIEFINGSVIEFRSGDDPDNLRGEGPLLIVLDEAAYVTRELWEEVLRPSLAETGGKGILKSTPKGKNYFFEMFQRGLDPEYPDFASFTFPSSTNPYIPEMEMQAAKAELPESVFKQEYLAEFLDDGAGVFRNIKGCFKGAALGKPNVGWDYVIGVDVAKHQDFTVICVLDKNKHLVDLIRFNKIEWPFQKARIVEYTKKWNNARVILDASGVGDVIYDDLKRIELDIVPYKFTNESKKVLIEGLAVDMEQDRVSYPNCPEVQQLIGELEIFGYEITRAGNVRYGAPQGYHDDCVIAFALANWGMRSRRVYTADEVFTHAF